MASSKTKRRRRLEKTEQPRTLLTLLLLLTMSFFALTYTDLPWSRAGLWVCLGGLIFTAALGARRGIFGNVLRPLTDQLAPLIESETTAKFIIDPKGKVLLRNEKARRDGLNAQHIQNDFRMRFLTVEDRVERLIKECGKTGKALETIVTRQANITIEFAKLNSKQHLCSVHQQRHSDTAHGPELPMLTAAANGTVLFMNKAARGLLGARNTKISEILDEDATMSDLNIVHTEHGPKPCFLMENLLSGGRREIFLIPAHAQKSLATDLSYEEMPVAVIKIDETGTILAANRTARRMIGPDAADKHHLSEIMEGLGRPLSDWLAEAAKGGAQNLIEFLRIKRDDKERFVQVTLGRAFDQDEPALYAVFHDATELKTLEMQFVQSQKMQAIGQLAGGIAHDFNNLLTAMSGHCDLLLMQYDRDDPVYSDLLQIHQNANRAAALVKQLLAYSRKQTLQPATIDLRDTMDDLSHLLRRLVADDVNLHVEHDENLASTYLDAQQFEQVVMNLVVNARDAMPDGGDVTVKLSNYKLRKPLARERATVPAGEYVRVQVIDQGVGIDKDRREKVFEPFYTTKETGEGTGLGLSTAYGIVKQSGGFIFVDSEVGKGTVFTLLFPRADKKAPVFTHQQQPIDLATRTGGTVLLVEDEAPVRAFASRALRMKGYSVLEASCGEEALDILQDQDLAVDLFLTDVAMPGMDGPTWVRKARETRDSQVIFISGYAEEKFSDQSSSIPNTTFLPKPFSLEELTNTVQRQISANLSDAAV
ncbi:Blue-light-activated protein [Cognatishimia activa]|uniref:histidine kinase n=1 Tax=Cognatishimia activa TaxID=1715691 RepID=A0A0P1IUF0_9RHOB|nr:Blue-light-activated protein [Cognatishimia activa]CUK27196.1 Blue-light-activated protein [Cognatishimia activa]